MAKIKLSCFFIGMLVFISPTVFSLETPADVAGVLSFIVGDIDVSPDEKTWEKGHLDMKIQAGDRVKTGKDSRCEVTLADQTIVRMDENSVQRFEKIEDSTETKTKEVFLSVGKLWLNARRIISKDESFKVRTNKAVCAIRGTVFSVEERNTYTQIRVLKGEVTSWSTIFEGRSDSTKPTGEPAVTKPYPVKGPEPVTMEEWVEVVKALQQITIDAKGGYEKQDFELEKISKDPWVEWNMKRDDLLIN